MSTPTDIKSPRYDRKFEQILAVAARIFAEEGYERASIRHIAAELGISLAGLYYYFGGKEELLFRIQYHTFEALLADLQRKLQGLADPAQKLHVLIHNHLEHFLAHIHELKVCSIELESLSGDYERQVSDLRRAYFRQLVIILEEIKAQYTGDQRDPRLAALALFGTLNWIYTWYDPQRYPTPPELADALCELFLQGYIH